MVIHPLFIIVGVGGAAVGTSGYIIRWRILKRLKQSPYSILAKANFLAHPPLMNLIGEPVNFGNSDVGMNRDEYSDRTNAKFCFPFKGSNTSGRMFFEAKRDSDEPNSQWKLTLLHAEVQERKPDRINVPIRFLTIDKVPSHYLNLENDDNNKKSIVQPNPSPAAAA